MDISSINFQSQIVRTCKTFVPITIDRGYVFDDLFNLFVKCLLVRKYKTTEIRQNHFPVIAGGPGKY